MAPIAAKTNVEISILGHFWAKMPKYGVLPKNQALSLLCVSGSLTCAKVSEEKNNERIPRKMHERTYGTEFVGPYRCCRGVQKICK